MSVTPEVSVVAPAKVALITWDMLKDTVQREGPMVDLAKIYDANKDALQKLPAEAVTAALTKGKTFANTLKSRIQSEGTLTADFHGLKLNISKNIDGNSLNVQRMTACIALDKWVGGKTDVETAMFKAIGKTSEKGFDEKFRTMLVPGYGFLYRAIFSPDSPGLTNAAAGDKGRYMAGGVLLDWLQYCRSGGVMQLDEYAATKMYQSQRGTVEQIRANAGDENLELKGVDLEVFRKILNRTVNIQQKGGATARLVSATATWTMK